MRRINRFHEYENFYNLDDCVILVLIIYVSTLKWCPKNLSWPQPLSMALPSEVCECSEGSGESVKLCRPN